MRRANRYLVPLAVAAAVATSGCQPSSVQQTADPSAAAQQATGRGAAEPAAIDSIKPGIKIDPAKLPERTHLVFRSLPKISSGAVDKVGKSIRKAIETYTTLVLVETEPVPGSPGTFRRAAHRVGIGKPGDDGDLVLTTASAGERGVSLGLFERKILSEREKELATVKSPGASSTMAMFDFTMTYLRDGKRVPITVRYMALVDPASGNVETAYWVLDAAADGRKFFGDSLRVLPRNHVMNWEMDVDGADITFGAPSSEAFASTKLPDGTDRPAPAELKAAATAKAYDAEAGAKLEKLVRAAVRGP